MSREQKATMNRRSFEHLKVKNAPKKYYYHDWDHDDYWATRLLDITARPLRPLQRNQTDLMFAKKSRDRADQCRCVNPGSCDLCIRFAGTDVTPETFQMWQELGKPEMTDDELRTLIAEGTPDRRRNSVVSLPNLNRAYSPCSEYEDDHDAYAFAISTSVRLPKISDIAKGRLCVAPGVLDGLEEEEEKEKDEKSVKQRTITMDEVKTCRYIRGFEPTYMRMPKDISRFIFNKSDKRHGGLKKKA